MKCRSKVEGNSNGANQLAQQESEGNDNGLSYSKTFEKTRDTYGEEGTSIAQDPSAHSEHPTVRNGVSVNLQPDVEPHNKLKNLAPINGIIESKDSTKSLNMAKNISNYVQPINGINELSLSDKPEIVSKDTRAALHSSTSVGIGKDTTGVDDTTVGDPVTNASIITNSVDSDSKHTNFVGGTADALETHRSIDNSMDSAQVFSHIPRTSSKNTTKAFAMVDNEAAFVISRKRLSSLGDYDEFARSELEQTRHQFEQKCVELMANLLGTVLPGEVDEEDVWRHLTESVDEDTTDSVTSVDQRVLSDIRRLHEHYQRYKDFKVCFLFLNAPYSKDPEIRNLTEDEIANTKQFRNMFHTIVGGHADKTQYKAYEVVIYDCEEMYQNIAGFFRKHVCNCERLAIVINGEGWSDQRAKGSLILCDGPEVVAMEEIVDEIMEIWKQTLVEVATDFSAGSSNQGVYSEIQDSAEMVELVPPLPHFVSVIFGQCHSHEYTGSTKIGSDDSQLEVFTLTHRERDAGVARSSYWFSRDPHTGDRSVRDSRHRELQTFAHHNRHRGRWETPKILSERWDKR